MQGQPRRGPYGAGAAPPAQFVVAMTLDVHRMLEWVSTSNRETKASERLHPAILLLKASAIAARAVPAVNGWWRGGFRAAGGVHTGLTIGLPGGGTVTPAIRDTDRLGLVPLTARVRDLVQRARASCLVPDEVTAATITVTILEAPADKVVPPVVCPRVAAVGFGGIALRPWITDGAVGPRPTVRAVVAGDPRACDPTSATEYLAAVEDLLRDPGEL